MESQQPHVLRWHQVECLGVSPPPDGRKLQSPGVRVPPAQPARATATAPLQQAHPATM